MTGAGNTTWLIPGAVPTLIDAGTGDPKHLEALHDALGEAALSQVLVTHNHSDHASGAPALRDRWPAAAFAKMPWPEKDARYAVSWRSLEDGAVIEAGDTTLEAIHTPGHAPDHLCFWHAATRTLFGGDLAMLGSTVVIPASARGDLGEYLASVERVIALAPERILPAHGPVIESPDRLLRMYLAHRREREDQILEALRAGTATVDAIVNRIYTALNERLVRVAEDSVLAHLLKLEKEGRAHKRDGTWTLPG
jgi:glyoxylase-like metal-dependent hydrolase (beta-lactamase superfamily II)